MFKEITVIDVDTNNEIMVDVDLNKNKIICVYCFSDAVPIIYNETTDKERKARTTEMKNKLFRKLNLNDFKTFARQGSLVACVNDDEEELSEEDEKENAIIHKVLSENFPVMGIV